MEMRIAQLQRENDSLIQKEVIDLFIFFKFENHLALEIIYQRT